MRAANNTVHLERSPQLGSDVVTMALQSAVDRGQHGTTPITGWRGTAADKLQHGITLHTGTGLGDLLNRRDMISTDPRGNDMSR